MKRGWRLGLLPALAVAVGLAVLGQGENYQTMDLERGFGAPAWSHPFGSDSLGRDLLARTTRGAGISLLVGLGATLAALALGGFLGGLAGFAGGAVEAVLMRAVDILYGLPTLFFAILLSIALGQTPQALVLSLACFSWMTAARLARAKAASLRGSEFVESARVSGAPPGRLLCRHIYPHLLPELVTYGGLLLPQLVLAEAFLSFLGLGLRPPEVSLGILLAEGAGTMGPAWWALFFPAAVLCAILVFGQISGEALKERRAAPDHLD